VSINDLHCMHQDDEGWVCPICGRRVAMTWEPSFAKTVVVEGDETVWHTGGIARETTTHAPWLAWMRDVGLA
jgi:hypothetical protein